MKRVLFAINNQSAENKLAKLIKEQQKDEEFQCVGTLVFNESITEFVQKKPVDILVYIEGLNGKDDGFDYILKLHRDHPSIRIVFIAGQRGIGDRKLAILVAFHIYDIVAGKRILMTDVADRIVNPAKFEDVSMYLPDINDIFRDADFRSNTIVQVAQNESDRLAEKVGYQKKISTAEHEINDLKIQVAAKDTRIKELEHSLDNYSTEAGKERLALEQQHASEQKALNDVITGLQTQLDANKNELKELSEKCSSLTDELAVKTATIQDQQTSFSQNIKTIQNDLRKTSIQLAEKETECSKLIAELDSLKASMKDFKDNTEREANDQINSILAKAEAEIKTTEELREELNRKLALYGDSGFEEYKEAELKRLEEERDANRKKIIGHLNLVLNKNSRNLRS